MVQSYPNPNPNPPLLRNYTKLVCQSESDHKDKLKISFDHSKNEECELPLIDLSGLRSEREEERESCAMAICRASSEWGFFQVVNHGISIELLRKMRREQVKLFEAPFESKENCGLFNNSYRWGNRTATSPKQFSWSEAFHVPLTKISDQHCCGEFTSLRYVLIIIYYFFQKCGVFYMATKILTQALL